MVTLDGYLETPRLIFSCISIVCTIEKKNAQSLIAFNINSSGADASPGAKEEQKKMIAFNFP